MKSYFHKHSNVRIRQKKCGKQSVSHMVVNAAGRHGGLGMVTALADENILDHQRVDGWTRWVACAYSEKRTDKPKTAKQRGQAFNGFRNFDDAKANGDRDWH